jgi:hypothetical protein
MLAMRVPDISWWSGILTFDINEINDIKRSRQADAQDKKVSDKKVSGLFIQKGVRFIYQYFSNGPDK